MEKLLQDEAPEEILWLDLRIQALDLENWDYLFSDITFKKTLFSTAKVGTILNLLQSLVFLLACSEDCTSDFAMQNLPFSNML